jgi:hypothetical protein
MTQDPRQENISYPRHELKALINEWDPVWLLEMRAPEDEYDCLVEPILQKLRSGQSAEDLTAFLDQHLAEHFGADTTPGMSADFVHRVMAWAAARRRVGKT